MTAHVAHSGEKTKLSPSNYWLYKAPVQYLLAGTVVAVIVFVRLGATTLDNHEAKAALAARGMVRQAGWLMRGAHEPPVPPDTPVNRWLIPVNNGRPRLVKTPLPYWCIASTALVTGRVDEWTARLPAAISAVLCVWVTLALGRRMFTSRAALMGAVMLATSLGLQKWGRNARPEAMLCLWVTAAMACFYVGLTARTRARRAGWMIGFWLAMGLANLSKQFFPLLLAWPLLAFVFWRSRDRAESAGAVPAGTARRTLALCLIFTAGAVAAGMVFAAVGLEKAWARLGVSATAGGLINKAFVLALPLVWLALRTRPWRDVGRLLPTAAPGAILMFAAFLPWMWYMHKLFPAGGGMFSEQVAQRAAGTGKWGSNGPHYYLLPLLTLVLPWVGFLPGALAVGWMRRFARHRHALTYLFLWLVVLVGLLTLSAGQRAHYILPGLPSVCLLMGFVAEDVFFRHRWITRPLGRLLGVCYAAVFLIAPLGVAVFWAASLGLAGWLKAFQSAPEPGRLLHLLIVTLVAAVAAGATLAVCLRKRLAGVFALIAASIVIIYVGFHAGGPLWDDQAPAAGFARSAAEIVPPGAAVASVGDSQAITVYYFGRTIPNMYFLSGEEKRRWSSAAAHLTSFTQQGRYGKLLRDPEKVAWVFSYGRYVRYILPLGFEVALRVQGKQKKRIVFTLLRNKGLTKATRTAWQPDDIAEARSSRADPDSFQPVWPAESKGR